MTAKQISAKRISHKYKRAAKFLCATALAGSAALSAFAPRDANADFTLHYEGKPFVPGTVSGSNKCILDGNIQIDVKFKGTPSDNFNGTMDKFIGTIFIPVVNNWKTYSTVSIIAKVSGVTYTANPKSYNSCMSSDGDVSFSDGKAVSWRFPFKESNHSECSSDDPRITTSSFNITYNSIDNITRDIWERYKKDNPLSGNFDYAVGCNLDAPGTWTIIGDGNNGGGDNGGGDNSDGTTPPADATQEANLGVDCDRNLCGEGNPIFPETGNKLQIETDFVGPAYTGIEFVRYYNSQDTRTTQFGANWRSTWDRAIEVNGTTVKVIRESGRVYTFTQSGSDWSTAPGVTFKLSGSASAGFTLIDNNDNTETYSGAGKLQTVKTRAGETTRLTYDNQKGKLTYVSGPYGHSLTFHHDANGFVDSVTLPDGKVMKYSVDGNKNLALVTYADNTTKTYVYNESANTSGANLPHALTGIIDGNGARFATYQYDAQNRGISTEHAGGVEKVTIAYGNNSATVIDALGNTHDYGFTSVQGIILPTTVTGAPVRNLGGAKAQTYDQYGFVATSTDFQGNVTRYTHSPRGQELSRTEAAGTALERTYTTQWHSKFNLPTQVVEPSGAPSINRVTTFTYADTNGALLKKTITAGNQSRVWSFDNDAQGHPTEITGPNGEVTALSYSAGAPISMKNALGHGYSMAYDANGRLVSLIDPNGLAQRTTYTPRGQVATSSVGLETTTYTYDAAQNLTGATLPDGARYTYQNDAAHQLVRILDALGNRQDLTRDLNGNITKEQILSTSGALVRQRSHAYDAVNRLVKDLGATDQTTTYVRDDNGNVTKATDPLGNTTTYVRDALNRVTKITAPDGGVTEIGYNPDNSIATVNDPRGNQTLYSYDGLGNPITEQSPDRGKITRTFDTAGNVLTVTDGRGKTTTNTYDLLSRLTRQQFADGTAIAFNYDEHATDMAGIGRLTSMVDASGTTTFDHDQRGHIVRKTQTTGHVTLTTTNTYDQQTGHLKTTVWPSGAVVDYGYNSKSGQPETITVNGQALIGGIQYEPFSTQVKQWGQGDGKVNLYYLRETDLDGNISKIVFGDTSASGSWGGQRILYSHDKAGRLLCANNNNYQDICNEYDGNSRLKGFKTQVPGITDGVYAYDLNGNRTWSTDALGDRDNHISAFNNQLEAVKSGSKTQKLTYDAAGNLTEDSKFAYTTDARGKFARVNGSGVDVRYAYNGLGERVKKEGSAETTVFAQDSYQVLGEYTGMVPGTGKAVAVQETVYLNGLPVGVIKPGGLYYVNPDPLGSPLAITNTAGTLVWSWEHAPFGDTLPNENPKGAGTFTYNLRFPGHYFDSEAGAHYNNARAYLPKMGFYQQPDPIGLAGGMNPYVYVGGNPVNLVDPKGNMPLLAVLPAIGGFIGGFSDLVSAGPCENKWRAFGRGFISGAVGTLAGMGAIAATGNPWIAGGAGGAVSNLIDQSLKADHKFSLVEFGESTVFGTIGGGVINKLMPTTGRLPSLIIVRNRSNFGPNSQRLVKQEFSNDALGGLSQYGLSALQSGNDE